MWLDFYLHMSYYKLYINANFLGLNLIFVYQRQRSYAKKVRNNAKKQANILYEQKYYCECKNNR